MLNKLPLKLRLMLVVAPLVIMLAVLAFFGLRGMSRSNESLKTVYADRTVALSQISEIAELMPRSRGDTQRAIMLNTPEAMDEAIRKISDKIQTIDKVHAEYLATFLTPDEKVLSDEFSAGLKQYEASLQSAMTAMHARDLNNLRRIYSGDVEPAMTKAAEPLHKMQQLQVDVAASEYKSAENNYASSRNLMLVLSSIGLLLAGLIGWWQIRRIWQDLGGEPDYAREVVQRIATGDLNTRINIQSKDSSSLLYGMNKMQSELLARAERDRQTATEVTRVKQGLDVVITNVMIADADLNIIYINHSIKEMLTSTEADIKKDVPAFNAKTVLGTNIDLFHKNPAHQRGMLARMKSTHKTQLLLGGRTFSLILNPIDDEQGKRLGYVVEWKDLTAEVAIINAERSKAAGYQSQLAAISRAQAVIEFTLDGHIVEANENFLKTLGYSLEEIKGQHHSMFVDAAYRQSADYRQFWERLGRGEYDAGQYKRLGKGGKEVWIQASYNPIFDAEGKPCKVVKYATDITQEKMKFADFEGQLAAIGKAQAVIEFTLDGKILNANENFLKTLGYSIEEIKGQHHSLFVDPAYRSSVEYRMFWEKLGRGEYDAGQYKRLGKGGREVWIQASYNPIFDMNGKPFKVVKYATDVTAQVHASQVLQQAVEQTQDVVSAAKDGDLVKRIPLEGKDGSIRELCAGVNSIVEGMENLVRQIKVSSDTINTAAREIAAGNTDLSQRTEEQASSLEETASSMEELTSTVKQNAENAKQANQLAIGASDIAVKGGKVVGEVVTTMSAINESSRKISDIIGVIDGIAFQTNILALNAAVEAARAGEQGRGFAVVAAEVRSLAQRSAGAAKEIKTLIGDSVGKVDTGTKLVAQAGQTMEEIVTSVKRVTDIMGEITAASQEQSSGIEQVNQAITQMDEVTQQNAALVEEASASARSLEEQAGGLVSAVAQYVISGESSVAAVPQVARAPAPVIAARKPMAAKAPVRPAPTRPAAKTAAAPVKRNGANGHHAGDKSDEQWAEF